MESQTTLTTILDTAAADKASKVIRWISESEDVSKTEFAIARVFETGVLQDNTKAFLHLLLEERYPDERLSLELPPEQLHALLHEAFGNTLSYLATPQSFIAEFLSFETNTVSINEPMLSRLSYFVDYPYFPEMLDEWFAIELQSGNLDIEKNILQRFLGDVDRSIMKYSSLGDIAKFLAPLYEFHGSQSLGRDMIEIILSDKGMTIPADNIQEEFSAEDAAFIIKEAYIASEFISPAEILAPIPQYDEFLKELRDVGVMLPPPHPHDPNEAKVDLLPMQMFINSKLRKKCMEKIFHFNTNEYDRAIILLNAIKDYPQAELNLRSLLEFHKVKPDSKVATRLNEALRMRFGITSPIHSF